MCWCKKHVGRLIVGHLSLPLCFPSKFEQLGFQSMKNKQQNNEHCAADWFLCLWCNFSITETHQTPLSWSNCCDELWLYILKKERQNITTITAGAAAFFVHSEWTRKHLCVCSYWTENQINELKKHANLSSSGVWSVKINYFKWTVYFQIFNNKRYNKPQDVQTSVGFNLVCFIFITVILVYKIAHA